MTPSEQIAAARARASTQREEWEQERRDMEEMYERIKQAFDATVLPYLRPASPSDYSRWLRGYLEQGGQISHAYDYPMPRRDWYVACKGFTLMPLYGSAAVSIIVPKHVTVECPNLGHNGLYFMDGFRTASIVPVFSDTDV